MADPISLADHAGARLRHGNPTVNGVELHYAIGGAVIPESGHNIALENPAALARAYLDFVAGR